MLALKAIRALLRAGQRLAEAEAAGTAAGAAGGGLLYLLDTHKKNYYKDPVAKIDLTLSYCNSVSL